MIDDEEEKIITNQGMHSSIKLVIYRQSKKIEIKMKRGLYYQYHKA